MSEQTIPNPERKAPSATAKQAETFIEEIERITANIPVTPGLEPMGITLPDQKIVHHENLTAVFYPEGAQHDEDPDLLSIASVIIEDPRVSRTSFVVSIAPHGELHFTKRIFPPQSNGFGFVEGADTKQLKPESQDVTQAEARDLIARLETIEPAL